MPEIKNDPTEIIVYFYTEWNGRKPSLTLQLDETPIEDILMINNCFICTMTQHLLIVLIYKLKLFLNSKNCKRIY